MGVTCSASKTTAKETRKRRKENQVESSDKKKEFSLTESSHPINRAELGSEERSKLKGILKGGSRRETIQNSPRAGHSDPDGRRSQNLLGGGFSHLLRMEHRRNRRKSHIYGEKHMKSLTKDLSLNLAGANTTKNTVHTEKSPREKDEWGGLGSGRRKSNQNCELQVKNPMDFVRIGFRKEHVNLNPLIEEVLERLKTYALLLKGAYGNIQSVRTLSQIFPDFVNSQINFEELLKTIQVVFPDSKFCMIKANCYLDSKHLKVEKLEPGEQTELIQSMMLTSQAHKLTPVEDSLIHNTKSTHNLIGNASNTHYCSLHYHSSPDIEPTVEDQQFLIIATGSEYTASEESGLFNIFHDVAKIFDFMMRKKMGESLVSTEDKLSIYVTNFMVTLATHVEEVFVNRARILIYKAFQIPVLPFLKAKELCKQGKRFIQMDYHPEGLLKVLIQDSSKRLNFYQFCFLLDSMLQDMLKFVDKKCDFFDFSNFIFEGKKLGLVVDTSDGQVVHFHFDPMYSLEGVINLDAIITNRKKRNVFQLDQMIKNEDVMTEIFNQVFQSKRPTKDIIAIKRKFYTIVYLNFEMPRLEVSVMLQPKKTLTAVVNKGLMRLKTKMEQASKRSSLFGQFNTLKKKNNFFSAVKISKNEKNAFLNGLLNNSGMTAFLDLKYTDLYRSAVHNKEFNVISKRLRAEEQRLLEYGLKNKEAYVVEYDDPELTYDRILDWNLDIVGMSMQKLCNLAGAIFSNGGFMIEFEIESSKFDMFATDLCCYYTYRKNPYHNFHHALNVLTSFNHFITKTSLNNQLSRISKFAGLIASFGHDVGHRGKNNGYEISSMSDVALTYHDKSVLEQYHISILMKIIDQSQSNILERVSLTDLRTIRKSIINCILATDMSKHKPLLAEFEKNMAGNKAKLAKGENLTQDQQDKIMELFMHCSDLSGTAKECALATKWSGMVRKEFIQQVKDEKANGFPLTPFLVGLEHEVKYLKGELFFQKCIVLHLFEVGNQYLDGEIDEVIDGIKDTYSRFDKRFKEVTEDQS